MSGEVIIFGSDPHNLMELVVAFRGTPYRITAVESARPIQAAARMAGQAPAALVVPLHGMENVVDMHALIDACLNTRLLFLVPRMPPSAAIARIVRAAGGTLLSIEEPAIVVVATLISVLIPESARRHSGAV